MMAPLVLLLAACGSETSGTFEGEDGETGEYTIDNSTGETTATIETEDGTATLRSGADVPVDLPGGFTVYPGAKVVSNTVVNQGEGLGTLVTMTTVDGPEKVAEFYKAQAEKAGIAIQMEMSTETGTMTGGESPDGLTFSIIASPQEDDAGERTIAQLAVGSKTD
jgi:hypothetical protein